MTPFVAIIGAAGLAVGLALSGNVTKIFPVV
jgi:small-conductance mechanosensitive channel